MFLKNKNIIFKIRRPKVTDYAALIELNPHATELIFHTPVPANKMELLVHNTTSNAPYIHPSHDLILELWRTFPNGGSS